MKQAKQKRSGAAVPIMDAEVIRGALRRIAHEIVERNPQLTHVVLAGIPSRGVEIAQRVAAFIHEIEKVHVETGVIDVAMHRDDVGTRSELPIVRESKLPLPLEERTVIVVDDVLYTGRTVRAAMDAINSFGRPARIQLAGLNRPRPSRAAHSTRITSARIYPLRHARTNSGAPARNGQRSRRSVAGKGIMMPRESILGSAGCQPATFGNLPNAPRLSLVNFNPCWRQAAANYRLAACAPQT